MPESEVSLERIVQILTHHWRWVLGFSLLVFVVVYLACLFLLDDLYSASVKLLVTKSKVGEKIQPVDFTMLELDTYVHLVTSRDSLKEAMEHLGLDQPPLRYRLGDLERRIRVRPLRNTDLLEVTVTLPDPGKAMQLANFLVDRAIEQNFQLLVRESEQSRRMFEGEVRLVRERLAEAADNLSAFMAQARTAASEDFIKSSQEALWKLKQDRSFNVALRDESQAKMRALSEIVRQQPETKVLRRWISDERDMLDLIRQRSPDARLEDLLRLEIKSENINYVHDKAQADLIDASKEYQGAIAHVAAMDEEIRRMEDEIRVAEQELAQKMRLEEELKSAALAFEDVSKKDSEAKTMIASERQDLAVIEHAVLPERPSGPNRALIAASAAFFAFVLALLVSLGVDLYGSPKSAS